MKTPERLEDFLKLCDDCEGAQRAVLDEILADAAETEIGRRLGLGNMRSAEEFCRQVPLGGWAEVAPYAERLRKGERDLLFKGAPPYFVCTSGTTGGVKIVPESPRGKAMKALTGRLRLEAIARHAPGMAAGKLLPLVNHAVEGYTEAGIPYGSASGLTLATASDAIKQRVAFPMAILDIDYTDAMDYILMRFAVAEDVRAVFGNNAGRIAQLVETAEKEADALLADIEKGTLRGLEALPENVRAALRKALRPAPERARALREAWRAHGRFLPAAYWPNLEVVACWLSGSVGRYVETLKPLLASTVRYFDVGYGATEGKFNIPLEPGNPAGPLAIHAAFYEFRPLNGGRTLMAHEVKAGQSYELVVTTFSGLFRYPMGDIVKVTGFTGTTPDILFEQKAGDTLNLCGEKVAASTLMPLVKEAVGEGLVHWHVIPDETQRRYHFRIETADEGADAKAIAERLETLLQERTQIYPIFRTQKLLNPLTVTLMPRGWQEKLYAERTRKGQSRAQVKLPLVVKSEK